MSSNSTRPCPCGSGKGSDCHQRKMAGYRTEVLTNPSYECDEAIEPEDY